MTEHTYTCQHCGDPVTARRRTSGAVNCPACAGLKGAASKRRGTYPALLEAFAAGWERGLRGAELRAQAEAAADDGVQTGIERHRREEEERARKARERAEQNRLLRAYGYRWHKADVGSEDEWAGEGSVHAGIGETVGQRWELIDPRDSETSMAAALGEISRGAVARAEAERRVAAFAGVPEAEDRTDVYAVLLEYADDVASLRTRGALRDAINAAALSRLALAAAGPGQVAEAGQYQSLMEERLDAAPRNLLPLMHFARLYARGRRIRATALVEALDRELGALT